MCSSSSDEERPSPFYIDIYDDIVPPPAVPAMKLTRQRTNNKDADDEIVPVRAKKGGRQITYEDDILPASAKNWYSTHYRGRERW